MRGVRVGINSRVQKVIERIRVLAVAEEIDFETFYYLEDKLQKRTFVDYIYNGFNNTFLYAFYLICDKEELKEYKARKFKKKDVPRGFATIWQFRNNWRVFKAWRLFNEDADNYAMDAGKAEVAEARNKRNYFDSLYSFWRTSYFWFYTWYVHKTKLEFWLRPLTEVFGWLFYIVFVPFLLYLFVFSLFYNTFFNFIKRVVV
jgi:hypothetical protein